MGIKRRRPQLGKESPRLSTDKGSLDSGAARVVDLTTSQPRIERSQDEHANPRLTLVFPSKTHRGKPLKLDVSQFLEAPHLSNFFAEGLLAQLGRSPNVNTADTNRARITKGILQFLREHSLLELKVSQLERSHVDDFINWLDGKTDDADEDADAEDEIVENGIVRAVSIRASHYRSLVVIVQKLSKQRQWKEVFSPNLTFPRTPWKKRNQQTKHKETIDDDLMTRIRIACIREAEEVIQQYNNGWEIINNSKSEPIVKWGQPVSYADTICLLHKELRDGILYPDLSNKLTRIIKKNTLTRKELALIFHPSPRSLVPFVLLLAIAAAYNSDVARKFRLSDFRYSKLLGNFISLYPGAANDETAIAFEKRVLSGEILLDAFKGRAGSTQPVFIPVDDAVDNPAVFIDFVMRWTKPLRKKAPPLLKNALFIYYTETKLYPINGYSGVDETSTPTVWQYNLTLFRKKHNLEYFTLDNIRPTILDVTREEFGGDIRAASIQGNHKHQDTTGQSYTSDAEKQRQYERLGIVSQKRVRWMESCGKIDSRDFPEEIDTNCATPGWSCIDAYDSPYSAKGKLCNGYGLCPNCPLGQVNLTSPLSYAYSISLLEAINRAQTSMAPQVWLTRWAPVHKKLIGKWLPSFTERAVKDARKLHIPPMATPE